MHDDVHYYKELVEVDREAQAAGEGYNPIVDNAVHLQAKQAPLSTFSIDVDTASYANMRRFLTQGALPPSGLGPHRGVGQLLPLRYPG